jgi:magnesium transporter
MTPALTKAHLADVVSLHMRRDFMQLTVGQSVGEALAAVRERPGVGRIIYFYVADADGRLCGVVPTRRLLLSPPDKPVADVMVHQVIAIPATATVLDACEFFTLHRLLAFPVVDAERRIVGVVDVDLYTEEMSDIERREGGDDLFQLIGVQLSEAQQASPMAAFRRRFPWLLCNIGAGLLAALLAGLYRAELAWDGAALALFVPVVLALAESVTIQSVSLALQTLHGRRPAWPTLLPRVGRELTTGLLLGAACGLVVGLVALTWLWHPGVALCLLGGVAGGVAFAAVAGLAAPNLLRLFRLDPRVAAGPLALALADIATLLLYFSLARVLLF